eukprot:3365680-Rhodomonas_salina.4
MLLPVYLHITILPFHNHGTNALRYALSSTAIAYDGHGRSAMSGTAIEYGAMGARRCPGLT